MNKKIQAKIIKYQLLFIKEKVILFINQFMVKEFPVIFKAKESKRLQRNVKFNSKTIETKTIAQRNQYQNKNIEVNKIRAERRNKNYNQSSYQRTINVEERKRNILPKTCFEKTYTEINKRRTTSIEQKEYVPPQKKYQQKNDESYKRKTQTQNNQKVLDTSKYQQKTEDT